MEACPIRFKAFLGKPRDFQKGKARDPIRFQGFLKGSLSFFVEAFLGEKDRDRLLLFPIGAS